ncbi:hypothetical protein B0A52_03027 [Exophiala mesophila]|uniref:HhH-GPD domain-containing protein n=1 Tax=Exophiala mesophila TaxID=212818 RepID=A0A438NC85_EXOME|nr:hypothetical protein B0A52_03027 [Exophiala mesophila]
MVASLPVSTSTSSTVHDNATSPPTPPSTPRPSPIDHLGMHSDNVLSLPDQHISTPPISSRPRERTRGRALTTSKTKKRRITYVSRHFQNGDPNTQPQVNVADDGDGGVQHVNHEGGLPEDNPIETPPSTPARSAIIPRSDFDIDGLSSDSSLTDVPDDIGPDPFSPHPKPPSTPSQTKTHNGTSKTKLSRQPTKSPFFPSPHKHRSNFLSTLPFPPLSHDTFGLMQERLAHDPFRLLIATIFLNKTPGERAMPVFYELMTRYPTPSDLASADTADIASMIHSLGFQNQRARKCVAMAKAWTASPPQLGRRFKKVDYPLKGDGRDVGKDDVLEDADSRVAWEISHLPGLGPYSHDSWRMFCRDKLRGLSSGWNGENIVPSNSFEPEWKRVLPLDKELRAWMTWMWMKEGWVWNKETGQKTKASDALMAKARGGGIVVEEENSPHLIMKPIDAENVDVFQQRKQVEHTAGDFLPGGDDRTTTEKRG